MKVLKIRVWKTAIGSDGCWVIDIYDEKGEYVCKMFSETKPEISSE